VALLNKTSRRLLLSRTPIERTVKLVVREGLYTIPRGPMEYADNLIIQSLSAFKSRGSLLEALVRELPAHLASFRVTLMSNELPSEFVAEAVSRELRFKELILCNVKCEHSDRVDSLLKSARTLRIFRSHFRQIFPRAMTNSTENNIEILQMEDVDFRVNNSVFNAERLRAIALKGAVLRPTQLCDIASHNI